MKIGSSSAGNNFNTGTQGGLEEGGKKVGSALTEAQNNLIAAFNQKDSEGNPDNGAITAAQIKYDNAKQVFDLFVAMVQKVDQTMQNIIQQFGR